MKVTEVIEMFHFLKLLISINLVYSFLLLKSFFMEIKIIFPITLYKKCKGDPVLEYL